MAAEKKEVMKSNGLKTIKSLFAGVIIHSPYEIQPYEVIELEEEIADKLIKKGLAEELKVNRKGK